MNTWRLRTGQRTHIFTPTRSPATPADVAAPPASTPKPAWDPRVRPPGAGGAWVPETSRGPAVPPIESVRRMVPKDHLWSVDGPVDEYWNFHAGGGSFKTMRVF